MSRSKGAPKKLANEANGVGPEEQASRLFPELTWHLSARAFAEGDPRDPGSLLIFRGDGCWKAMLKDKNDGTCLWVAAATLDGLFAAVEASLTSPDAEWRTDRKGPGDVARRVKKK